MTIFERFAEWAKQFFTKDKLEVVAADIETLIDAVGDDLQKAEAFIAVLQNVVAKIKGDVTIDQAADQANAQVAEITAAPAADGDEDEAETDVKVS